MKLSNKEKQALNMLRHLNAQQRDSLLAKIERAYLANRIAERAGNLRRVKPVPDHKIVKAFGAAPRSPTKGRTDKS